MAIITYEKGDVVELFYDSTLNTHLEISDVEDLIVTLQEECDTFWWATTWSGERVQIEKGSFKLT